MPDFAVIAVPRAGRIGDVLPVRLSCLAKPRGHQASERHRVPESQVPGRGGLRRLVVHVAKPTGNCQSMSQVLARHGPESFDGIVESAGKGHGRLARQFLVEQAPDGIDSLSMGDIARDVRVVSAEDPERVV